MKRITFCIALCITFAGCGRSGAIGGEWRLSQIMCGSVDWTPVGATFVSTFDGDHIVTVATAADGCVGTQTSSYILLPSGSLSVAPPSETTTEREPAACALRFSMATVDFEESGFFRPAPDTGTLIIGDDTLTLTSGSDPNTSDECVWTYVPN